jgi:hypothetical protein
MKIFILATLVAAILLVGVFVSVRIYDDKIVDSEETVGASQDARLSQLEDKLSAVNEMREEVKALTDLVARLETAKAEETADRAPGQSETRGASFSSSQGESVDEKVIAAVAEVLKTPEGREEFEGAVREGVRQFQQEERRKRQLRTAAIKEEIEELSQGPYGKYNLKVNAMAKWLDLDDNQKDAYHTQVEKYDAMIEETRTREGADAENYDKYHEERENLRKEFASVFDTSLSPEQSETFNALETLEKRPDKNEMTPRLFYGHEMRADRAEATESSDSTRSTESTNDSNAARER